MRWQIKGAYVETGAEVSMTIEAITQQQAELAARCKGVGVEKIWREGEEQPGEPAVRKTAAPTLLYSQLLPIPSYSGLGSARIVLAVLAAIAYISSGIVVVYALFNYQNNGSDFIFVLLCSGLLVCLGAILHALSAMCSAFRDMARNSFGQR